MSKLGETADRVLELLSEEEKLSIDELKEKASLTDAEILTLLKQGGLIKLRKEEASITKFGSDLLTVE